MILAEISRVQEAIALIEHLATRNVQNLSLNDRVLLQCTAVRCALATGNLDQASTELDAITRMDIDLTDYAYYWELRGDIAAVRGEYATAAANYRTSVAILSAKANPRREMIQEKLSALDSHESM